MDDIIQIAHAAAAAVDASVMAYGHAVITKAEDRAADGTVRLGQRILASLRQRKQTRPALESAIQDLAGNPADSDALAALRMQIRSMLASDKQLIQQVRGILRDSADSGIYNSRVSAKQNYGIISTGSYAVNKVAGNGC
jgi:hypothetical protein